MLRNTLYLAAAATLLAAPALAQTAPAQDSMGQTPPTASAQTPPPAAPSGSLQLQPGASVKGSDGATLGTLEGVQTNAVGEQELTVRGADGQLRGVPLGGLTQQGADVVVGWTASEYQAAPAVVEDDADAPASAADPATTPATPTEPQR